MADPIEDAEGIIVVGLVGLFMVAIFWAIAQFGDGGFLQGLKELFKNLGDVSKLSQATKDTANSLAGGAGQEGQSQYVSASDNISRWSDSLFGTQADQDFASDPTSWNTVVSPSPDVPISLQSPDASWEAQFLQDGEGILLPEMPAVPDGPGIDGDQILNWAMAHKLF